MQEIAIPEIRQIAHGPAGALVEPDWPPLTLTEVDALLRRYPGPGGAAGGALRLLMVSPRPFSAASVVETRQGQVFVKRHHQSVRSREGVLEEHRLMQYLAAACWTDGRKLVEAPLADADGETVQVKGEWTYEVHPVSLGVDLYREAHSWTPFESAEHARAAGRTLAAMHLAVAEYDAAARAEGPLVTSWTIFAHENPMAAMERYLGQRPLLLAYAEERHWPDSMQELLLPWHARLQAFLPHLKPLWTHNDFHASNLMWSVDGPDAEVTAIVDFGLSDRTNAVHDLATAIERNCIEWLRIGEAGIVHTDHVDALLAGYEEIRQLDAMEAQAVRAMLPLVHCEFALSETNYYLSVLKDRAKAFLGYEGYFLGHAAWFREAEGAALLRHLERWANTRKEGRT